MELGGSKSHSQGLSINPYPEPNQPNSSFYTFFYLRSILILSSHLSQGLRKSLCPLDVTNAMAFGAQRFNAAFTRALQ